MIPATACILIGGDSNRFGSQKWRAVIDGTTVIDRIWDACEFFEYRQVIGKDHPEDLDKDFIKDMLEIKAPINGLHAALENSNTDWIFLLSCDLPLVSADILIDLWNETDATKSIIVPMVNKRLEPTCALYHKRILSTCNARIQKNDLGLNGLIKSIEFHCVDMTDRADRFFNMNTKNDMSEAEKILRLKRNARS